MSGARFAGDVDVNKVAIVGDSGYFDISKLTIGIDMYENIFFPFVRGIVTIDDAQDSINKINFKEKEFLELEFNTPDKEGYKSTYYIYKVSDKVKTADKKNIYSIYFIHVDAVNELISKLSKTFKDKPHITVDQIIKEKVPDGLESKEKLDVEDTNKKLTYTSNYWSPCQNIYHLCKYAVSTKDNPAYLFFQNNEGYHFKTFDKLIEQEPKAKFKLDNFDHTPKTSCSSNKDLTEYYERILTVKFPQMFNFGYETLSGVFQSLSLNYDQVKKKYVSTIHDDNWDKVDHLNKEQKMKEGPKKNEHAAQEAFGQKEFTYEDQEDGTNIPTKQERDAIFARYARTKTKISVFGNSELWAGNVVELEVIKQKGMDEASGESAGMVDPTYSGKYIISAVAHHVNKENYETHLELIRDAFQESEEDSDKPKDEKPKDEKPDGTPKPDDGSYVPTFDTSAEAEQYNRETGGRARFRNL